jgi:hypothetical protein
MPKFIILLKNEKLKTYTVIGWLIIALHFFAFIYVGVSKHNGIMTLPFYAAGLLMIIFIFHSFSNREAVENDTLSLSFSVAVIAWIVLQLYWSAVVTFFLFLFQDISRRQLVVLVYEDRIIYPSFPKRTIVWEEMNNAILKDGWLTIDLKNNKVFQNEIVSPTSEIEFNEFCDAQLQALKK